MKANTNHRQQNGQALLMLLLILGALSAYFAMQIFGNGSESTRSTIDTGVALSEAKDALTGYVVTHSCLPCPDRTAGAGANDGIEDRPGGACTACSVAEGNLPWVTLGLVGLDAWGHRLHYRVDTAFTNSVISSGGSNLAALIVNNENGSVTPSGVPAVVLSYGKNGWGATSSSGGQIGPPPATNINERENTNGNNLFFAYAPADSTAAGGEFDDLVTWLDATTIHARMLQAGLP